MYKRQRLSPQAAELIINSQPFTLNRILNTAKMYFSTYASALLVSSAYWTGAASISLPQRDIVDVKRSPDFYGSIDLDAYASGNATSEDGSSIIKRASVSTPLKHTSEAIETEADMRGLPCRPRLAVKY